MLTVLLADDERLILKGFYKLIDWERRELRIVGEAYNGQDLLEAIHRHQPDIVISDIVMPGMSGLEVMKKIKHLKLATQVIFISAFRDFSFAQEALALGAADYLVKPVDQDKLEEALDKAAAAIRNAKQSKHDLSRLAELEQRQRKDRELQVIERLLDGASLQESDRKEAASITSSGHVELIVIVVEREDIMNGQQKWETRDWRLLQFAVRNIMEDTLAESEKGWIAAKDENVCAVVLKTDNTVVDMIADIIRQRLELYMKLSVVPAISGSVSLERLSDGYRQARDAAAYRFFIPRNKYFRYDELPLPPEKAETRMPDEIERELLQIMTTPMKERLSQLCMEWEKAVACASWGNRDETVNRAYIVLLMAFRQTVELGVKLSSSSQNTIAQLRLIQSLRGISEFLKDELAALQFLCSKQQVGKESVDMAIIKAYISEHYHEDISLESMAGLAFMNASYFSTFFKKHTGKNFKQYVTELRMKEALRLLMETDMMIYEVSEHVGYNNSRQFSDMFRKYYGVLPNNYRQGQEGS